MRSWLRVCLLGLVCAALSAASLKQQQQRVNTVYYNLEVSNFIAAPDGVPRDSSGFNGSIPGPLLTVTEGDSVEIQVTNFLWTEALSVR